ncbi:uncharacterized protein L201_005034 [Kwoniella dendrophila CBS 6074]|uniref:Kinesin motor domain-containing protein n=1 Tax=Kwoniella dendrophila CBS 6074 TaxID=1295534 RepID=A0AAX4JXD6_9TREE
MPTSKSISCHVRLRPSCPTDGKIDSEAIRIEGNDITALNKEGDKRYRFSLDKCHPASGTQEEVFEHVKPLVEQAYQGQNTTIFTYGVTGSGKTHTMQGSASDPGIIPRTVEAIFERRSILKSSTLRVTFSYVEILKDEVFDLLGDRSEPRKRDIRMSSEGENIIADLIIQPISSIEEFSRIYNTAAKTRKTASTKLNSSSSRSHAILTIYLQRSDSDSLTVSRQGKICLTDLAGSENNNLTGNDKERMRESSAINTSLTTLGKVVDALNLNAQKGQREGGVFVPYRESKLTRLLQDALGGSSQGLLICCLAPGEQFARDTINTLQFAKKSKSVENRLNVTESSSRRASAPITQIAKKSVIGGPIRANIGPRHSAPTDARTALSAISANSRPMRGLNIRNQPGKENVIAGGKVDQKGNILKGMTDEQLDQRIHKVVSQQIALEKEFIRPTTAAIQPGQTDLAVRGETEMGSLSADDKENRARVITSHARQLQHSGDLQQALSLYRKAFEYAPSNRKLPLRITELELAIEGIIPSTSSSSTTTKESHNKSGMKRSLGHLGSLAELSHVESPAKKGRS